MLCTHRMPSVILCGNSTEGFLICTRLIPARPVVHSQRARIRTQPGTEHDQPRDQPPTPTPTLLSERRNYKGIFPSWLMPSASLSLRTWYAFIYLVASFLILRGNVGSPLILASRATPLLGGALRTVYSGRSDLSRGRFFILLHRVPNSPTGQVLEAGPG